MSLFDGDDSWKKHGPGTCEWNTMFRTSQTGLYPDREANILTSDEKYIQKWNFVHTGSGNYEGSLTGSWPVDMLKAINKSNFEYKFRIPDDNTWYKTVRDTSLNFQGNGTAVVLTQIKAPSSTEIEKQYGSGQAYSYLVQRDKENEDKYSSLEFDPQRIKDIAQIKDKHSAVECMKAELEKQLECCRDNHVPGMKALTDEYNSIVECYDNGILNDAQMLKELTGFSESIQRTLSR